MESARKRKTLHTSSIWEKKRKKGDEERSLFYTLPPPSCSELSLGGKKAVREKIAKEGRRGG